jgi:intracellular sulfur oxidation DsrE/DsrF family protein
MHTVFATLLILVVGDIARAAEPEPIAHLLARETPPPGVVFEIVSADDDALEKTLPQARDATRRLRARFPGLDVVVVSHGREQFALLADAAEARPRVHAAVRSLLAEEDVSVQVCGTHAGWYGKETEDFPDYVDVAVSAPAQINDYVALGYEVVLLAP